MVILDNFKGVSCAPFFLVGVSGYVSNCMDDFHSNVTW